MTVLRGKGVTRVGWVTMSERRASSAAVFAAANQALNAARARWPELVVLDWNQASSGADRDRWYADSVHLTNTGQSEFALWLRSQALALATAGPGKLGAGRFLRVKIPGVGDVPSTGVSAVALNVTAVDPSGWGFFTVWPCGSPMPPDASHVNFLAPGAVEPNSVLAQVDASGDVCVWTYAASHVLVDVNGWFTSGFRGRAPARIVDTRGGQGAPLGRLPAGQTLRVHVSGNGGVPTTGVSAVALNVTAVEPTGWGFFTVWPCGSPMPPDASHVNFISAGAVEPNSVLVPVDSTGDICIWTYEASHVLVDVNGWFEPGSFEGRAPDRIVDTRSGQGAPTGRLGAGQTLRVPVSGVGDVPASGVTAVALNVTAVEPTGWGFFTVWPCGSPMPPDASSVNFVRAGAVEPNSVLVPVDSTGEVCIWTYAASHVLVDINGWFTSGFEGRAPAASSTPAAASSARSDLTPLRPVCFRLPVARSEADRTEGGRLSSAGMDITGASAIVTGGASGIGAAAARGLSAKGAKVVVADLQEDKGSALADEIGGAFCHVDVTNTDDIINAVEMAKSMGPLRVLVNSAGIGWAQRTVGKDGSYESAANLDAFKKVIAINLIGSFDCIRLAATAMSQTEPLESGERGAIVNVASVAAFDGQIGQASYSASKGGIVGMTLPVARDLAAIGVRVNTVAPGLIDTPIYGEGEGSEAFKANLQKGVLFPQRLGSPEELASMVLELVTNSYMNAETIRVDGGIRMPPK